MTDQPQTEVTRLGVTAEEFDTFVNLPENADKLFELIGGRIVEVMPTNIRSSQIAGMIITFINMYLLNNPIGYTTTTDGGYMVAGERYIPDVAYISKAKMPKLPVGGGYYHLPPDLAVEVLSPGNTSDEVRRKVAGYLAAGVLTWVFDPDTRRTEVYAPGKAVELFDIDGVLDGGDVLPGFKLVLKNVYPPEDE